MENTKDITTTDHPHDSNDHARKGQRDEMAKDAMKGLRPDDDFIPRGGDGTGQSGNSGG